MDNVDTDAGHCFIFNGKTDDVVKTKRTGELIIEVEYKLHNLFTGSEFGLRLVLNIESYQYVNVFDQTDAGIKVHHA